MEEQEKQVIMKLCQEGNNREIQVSGAESTEKVSSSTWKASDCCKDRVEGWPARHAEGQSIIAVAWLFESQEVCSEFCG